MLALSTLILAAVAVHAGTPDQASNFPVSPQLAAKYDCGEACQATLNKTNAKDLQIFDTPFDFDFYATAKNFSGSKPGDVLKLSPVNPDILSVPAGVAVYKIQYTSTDLDNSPVPATGFIAFPFVRQSDPFKLVAYAHGTTGMFRGCAPSTSSFLFDYNSWTPLVLAGYAIVGTDYAGLGNNNTAHKYVSSRANANDVYWSAVAARKAFPCNLSREWVSIGHSQGGGASWKLSEHELVQSERSGYLGGVSIGPVTYLYDALLDGFSKLKDLTEEQLQNFGIVTLLPSMAFALRAIFPKYTPPYFSDLLKSRIELGEVAQLCDNALSGLVRDANLTQLIKNVDLASDKTLKKFQELNAPAQGDKTSKPLLVIQGAKDSIVFPDMTTKAYKNSCKAGNAVRLSLYPELDHTAVVGASAPEWLEFIDKLFHHRGLHKCSMKTMVPFDADHASKPLDTE
ncbi:hypothetical protein BFJ63_vAg18722 [Fusarium oxysporum f. sp. narcissi]|uniref:Peptidase S9 prolyl oligopeptidase catalytic domain-containing protein n=1 Tax=Fusarium oxysporum f. sp. narcissi TaxID=451672 RepID=A0A4Q2UWR9_FUSOX|nr:hypothetical protein BFJ63_vAg18722 [Fusarium oxysporum f. sp. narcissi]